VHDAAAGGHPLHVTGAELAAMTCGVLVLGLALEEVRDGLEASVRVIGRAHRATRRGLDRAHLVEEEEGVELLEPADREGPAYDEASAFDGTDGRDHAEDVAGLGSSRATGGCDARAVAGRSRVGRVSGACRGSP
jgi:hypothetical protein